MGMYVCGEYIAPNCLKIEFEDLDLCNDCTFINGLLSESDYLVSIGEYLPEIKSTVHNGKIYTWSGDKKPWEKKAKDYRKTPEYRKWRISVFERDEYTCQNCHEKGGRLEGHHIKKFIDYPDLRFDIDNGLTLCVECHREEHRVNK
jgi:hypothetical protein